LDGKLSSQSFRSINGGQSIDFTIDAASLYDLSEGGRFDVAAEGFMPFASGGKKKIVGEASYKSNSISLEVNGTEAAHVKEKFLARRNLMQADCQAGRLDATRNALAVCSNLAYVAGVQALRGNNDQYVYLLQPAAS